MNVYDEKLIEFLSAPQNVRLALEVGERYEEIKKALAKTFWDLLRVELATQLKTHDLAGAWEIQPCPENKIRAPDKNDHGLVLVPKGYRPWCGVSIQVENLRGFIGVRFGEPHPNFASEAGKRLAAALTKADDTSKQNADFLGWLYGPENSLFTLDFFETIADGKRGPVEEYGALAFSVFDEYNSDILRVNSDLRDWSPSS